MLQRNYKIRTPVARVHFERSQGADVIERGVSYRTWCKHDEVNAVVLNRQGTIIRSVPLAHAGDGYFHGIDEEGAAGDLYQYRFGQSEGWPDPASRYQPFGVHGPSMVVDPRTFTWTDRAWRPPVFQDLVIYELHVGTFTDEGTFRGAIMKLPDLANMGVTAIELMPVADFPGDCNWGYDGVMLYAPARVYGTPDDLRALVDAAHGHGIAVILDVVYNHFGPDGNYTGVYHDGYYAHPRRETPWGAGLNYSAPAVRALFAENPRYWREEFRVDGFRLDATHAISDRSERHILAEITDAVHETGAFAIAEDDRRLATVLRPTRIGGLGFDACWADDFHHVVHVGLTGEREGYYKKFGGSPAELARVLRIGWFAADGENSDCAEDLGPERFVFCISNHDQVGNRAFGERLGHLVGSAEYRAASLLLCLAPQIPLLFMGQEWNASTPFQFFTDHNPQLGADITRGRRLEFKEFAAFREKTIRETIPDPQARETFSNSRLRWSERAEPEHAAMLELYREGLNLRHRLRDLRHHSQVMVDEAGVVMIRYGDELSSAFFVVTNLLARANTPAMIPQSRGGSWRLILSSNDERFGGPGGADLSSPVTAAFEFDRQN